MSTIRQLRDEITSKREPNRPHTNKALTISANTIAIATLNSNNQALHHHLHARTIQNQTLVIRNAELEAEIKQIRDATATLESQSTANADPVTVNARRCAPLAELEQKFRFLKQRERSEQASVMTARGELRVPEVKDSRLSPLSAAFVPAGSAGCGKVGTCSSRFEIEALRSERGVRREEALRLERMARGEEACFGRG
ncbi:hypothetical protein BDV97DRAFT_359194 [Delphinella strobiligena]|nr:hypothetical protein BDV97DRAFT_359194 [Delphinella strobiligena]